MIKIFLKFYSQSLNKTRAKTRNILLGVFTFLTLMFTYLIFCFCGVYPQTQGIFFAFGLFAMIFRIFFLDFLYVFMKTCFHHFAMKKKNEYFFIFFACFFSFLPVG